MLLPVDVGRGVKGLGRAGEKRGGSSKATIVLFPRAAENRWQGLEEPLFNPDSG